MYYGNPTAESAADGADVFEFFDNGDTHTHSEGLISTGGYFQGNSFNGEGINEYSTLYAYSDSLSLHMKDKGGEIYHSSQITSIPQKAECMIYVPLSDIAGARSYFSIYEGSSSWGYESGISVLSKGTNWHVGYGGTEYSTSTELVPGWHKATIEAYSNGSAKCYIDDTLLSVSAPAYTLTASDNKVGLGTYSATHDSYFDDVRVIKFVLDKPTYIIL